MDDSKVKYWNIDETTYNKLQVIKQLVDFIAVQKETTPEHKANADKIKDLIENLNNPDSFICEWTISIDLFDTEIQSGNYGYKFESNKGLYWKKWFICFESGILQIASEEDYADQKGMQNEKIRYYGNINFNGSVAVDRIYGDTNYSEFITDAKQFRKYITEDLNEVETEISFYL